MEPSGEWQGSDLLELFLRNPVSNHTPRPTTGTVRVLKQGEVVCVDVNEHLPSVLKKLSTEGFLSAPVLRGRTLVGRISLLDIVKYINGMFYGTSQDDWIDYFNKKLEFSTTTVEAVMPHPSELHRDPCPSLHGDYTTLHALEQMARDNVQSLVTMHNEGKIGGILTQSMVVSFLRQTKAKWGDTFRTKTVSTFRGLKPANKLKKVLETDTAMNAFLTMELEGVNGLPVVDAEGVLVDCISIRDLRGVGANGSSFHRLFFAVSTFKDLVRREYPRLAPPTHYSHKPSPVSAVYVTPSATLEEVIDKMSDGNLHRVFICSDESHRKGRPIVVGVIAQSDVLLQTMDRIIQLAEERKLNLEHGAIEERSRTRKISPGSPTSTHREVPMTRLGHRSAEGKSSPTRAASPEKEPPRASPGRRSIPIVYK